MRVWYCCGTVVFIGLACGTAHARQLQVFSPSGQVQFEEPGGPQPAPPGNTNGKRYPVSGTVYNSVTNEPIRRALVRINGREQRVAFTGADGRFEMENVSEGPIIITAERPGYFDPKNMPFGGGISYGSNGNQTVGAGSNDFRVPLTPESKITGRVLDPQGEPIEGVQVQVLSQQLEQGRKRWMNRGGASTDDDGYYRVDDQVPGPVILSTVSTSRGDSSETYATRFYPDSPDQASAQIITLAPGQETRADFTLTAVRTFTIRGSLSGLPAGVRGVSMWAEGVDGNPIQVGLLQYRRNGGRFQIRAMPAGSWTLHFQANDPQGKTYEAIQDVNITDSDLQGLNVVVQAGGDIKVAVHRPAGTETEPGGSTLQQQVNGFVQVRLVPLNGGNVNMRQYWSQMAPGPNGEPGEMSIQGVPPGRYNAVAQQVSGGCLDSITYGNTDVTREPLVITAGTPPQTLNVNLRNDCASLEVKLQTERSVSSGTVILISESLPSEPQILPGAPNSSLRLPNLSPGRYRVYAVTSIDGLEYANPEAMRGLASQEITLEPGQNATVTAELVEPTHS